MSPRFSTPSMQSSGGEDGDEWGASTPPCLESELLPRDLRFGVHDQESGPRVRSTQTLIPVLVLPGEERRGGER